MAADVEAEDLACSCLRLVGIVCELDAAGLTAAAGEDLRLDDDLTAELLGRGARLFRHRRETAFGDRYPEAPEELLPLILVEVHGGRECTRHHRSGLAGCAVARCAV